MKILQSLLKKGNTKKFEKLNEKRGEVLVLFERLNTPWTFILGIIHHRTDGIGFHLLG
jgi:hypothetical protein